MTATSLDLSQIKTDALSSAATFRTLIGLGSSDAVTFKEATLTSGTVTSSTPVINATQTWNDGATTFTGALLNVTDTASASASLLMDLQVGGSSRFSVSKNGTATVQNSGSPFLSLIGGAGGYPAVAFYNQSTFRGQIQYHPVFNALLVNNVTTFATTGRFGLASFSAIDVFLERDAANTLAQRNGTNAQTFRLYNTYTSSTSYERGFMRWNSNVFEIGAEVGSGGGSLRELALRIPTTNDQARATLTLRRYQNWDPELYSPTKIAITSGLIAMTPGSNGVTFVKDINRAIQIDPINNAMQSIFYGSDFTIRGPSRTSIDEYRYDFNLIGGAAAPNAVNFLVGGRVRVLGGDGATNSSGDAHGGNVLIAGGTGYGTGHDGYVVLSNLPSTDPATDGAVWNNGGFLNLSSTTPYTGWTYSPTWNDGATTFTGILANITDTASASSSLLMDLQVGGMSKEKTDKNGNKTLSGNLSLLSLVQSSAWTIGQVSVGIEFLHGATALARFRNIYGITIAGGKSLSWGASTGTTTSAMDSPDLFLFRDAADTLAQRNSTNAQTFNIYNTYTSDTSYERGFMRWNSNVLEIGTEAGSGGGTLRNTAIIGNKLAIGSSTVSPDCSTRITFDSNVGSILELRNTNNNDGSTRIGQKPDSAGLYLTSNIYALAESVHDYSVRWGVKIETQNASTGPSTYFQIRAKPSGTTTYDDAFRVDWSTTAGDTRLLLYDVDTASLVRVSVGAADSGGTGYKVLRIPN